jgi:hypothetical protein
MAHYLVEAYQPRAGGKDLDAVSERVRRAAAELSRNGSPVRYLRGLVVPEDELYLHLFEAVSADAVHTALARAAVAYERIVETEERTWTDPQRDADEDD